jgi:hypothetical protein
MVADLGGSTGPATTASKATMRRQSLAERTVSRSRSFNNRRVRSRTRLRRASSASSSSSGYVVPTRPSLRFRPAHSRLSGAETIDFEASAAHLALAQGPSARTAPPADPPSGHPSEGRRRAAARCAHVRRPPEACGHRSGHGLAQAARRDLERQSTGRPHPCVVARSMTRLCSVRCAD